MSRFGNLEQRREHLLTHADENLNEKFLSLLISQYDEFDHYVYWRKLDKELIIRARKADTKNEFLKYYARIPIVIDPSYDASHYLWIVTVPHLDDRHDFVVMRAIVIAPNFKKLERLLRGQFNLRLVDDQIDFYDIDRYKLYGKQTPKVLATGFEDLSDYLLWGGETFDIQGYKNDRENYEVDSEIKKSLRQTKKLTMSEGYREGDDEFGHIWRQGK